MNRRCLLVPGDDGRVTVHGHQVWRDRAGVLLSDRQVRHVYTIRDGFVARMDIV